MHSSFFSASTIATKTVIKPLPPPKPKMIMTLDGRLKPVPPPRPKQQIAKQS